MPRIPYPVRPPGKVEYAFVDSEDKKYGFEVVTYPQLVARTSEEGRFAVHRAGFHQIFVWHGGRGSMMVDCNDYPCSTGTVVHVTRGRIMTLPQPVSPDEELNLTVLFFGTGFPSRIKRVTSLLSLFGPILWQLRGDDFATVEAQLRRLRDAYEASPSEESTHLQSKLLGALLIQLADLTPTATDPVGSCQVPPLAERFRFELERSMSETRKVADYARRVGTTTSRLNDACYTATGRTAKQLINHRSILEAKRLLLGTDHPIDLLSAHLGFPSASAFSSNFQHTVGVTPTRFRQRERARLEQQRQLRRRE